jgi:U32 family peptidase
MRPEVLAPAGDEASMRAAIRAGADAVYFGVRGSSGKPGAAAASFNARARAANFDLEGLRPVLDELHAHGVKGYVTLNTLVFDHELPAVEEVIRACAQAGADAIIVQDLGVKRLARAVAPSLPVHASTQMTCTDAASVAFATELGATRVVVARELSIDDIASIRAATGAELEVFVHGALCVSYSGQCLTSEAIGGRSANRGACAQACRLPYDLVVDGVVADLGDLAYLLSPQDLEASALVERMAALGVSSLKIEGRLKGPEYVGSTTRLYRAAVDGVSDLAPLRRRSLLTYSRGSGPGFLAGVNHQALVEARTCEHRGVLLGEVLGLARVRGRAQLRLVLAAELARGAGVFVEGGRAGEGERGGRVWDLVVDGESRARAEAGAEVLLWLGPDVPLEDVSVGRRIFKNDDPEVEKHILQELERAPHRELIDVVVRGDFGEPLRFEARSARGLEAVVRGDAPLEQARARGLDEALLREKLARLGDSPFALGRLTLELPAGAAVSPSSLNRARRALVDALVASAMRVHETTHVHVVDLFGEAEPRTPPPPPGLFVLCRTEEQAQAALAAGADGVWLDFLALTGLGRALEGLRAARRDRPFQLGVAPPRIRKPGEEKIDRFLLAQRPDAVLVRSLGALRDVAGAADAGDASAPLFVGDFSLNVTNRLSASAVLARGLAAFTPSFDLDAKQLQAMLETALGPHVELVIHHPMPLFHMEHCVFAALLSEGRDYRSCGRPCESHTLSLRDRVGLENPVEADVGCRNTVFHAKPQSAASLVPIAMKAGARRFRIELVRESAADVTRLVGTYGALLSGAESPATVFRALRTEEGYGVVRGSLRVMP